MDPRLKTKFGLLTAFGLVAVLAIFVPSHAAHASWFGIDTLAAGVIGYAAFILLYIVTTIVGVLIAIQTYFIAVILQLSDHIVNTIAVQSGFAVTLAVANLGFVLGIIVIAIATILRRETYGIKKTLWKLVVAAILVNFSLVIGGVILTFANAFTTTFLTALPGGGGDNGPLVFAKTLAGAFSPQRALLGGTGSTSTAGSFNGSINNQSIEDANAGGTIASIITPIISVACAVALLIVIVITLSVFTLMLLIRYVTLSILLVLMPFAWLMWIFPKTSHMWTKWWNEFIRWTFFAPIVIFFLWLAIATAQKMNEVGVNNPLAGTTYTATSGGILGGISSTFGSGIGAFAGAALQGVIVVGLAIGGMFAANKLSIMGAGAGMGAMKSAGNAVKGYAGRRSKQIATAPLRGSSAKNLASQMQQRSPNRLMRLTGLDYVKRQAGRAMQAGAATGGEKAVDAASESFKGLTAEQRLNRISTVEGPYGRIQLLKQIADDKNLGRLSSAELEKYVGKDKKAEFERYGQGKLYEELRQKSGLAFRDVNKEIETLKGQEDSEDNRGKIAAKETEKNRMLSMYLEDNTDAAADVFTNSGTLQIMRDKAAKTGRVPAALEPESLALMQNVIAQGITKGLSPHNVSSLVNAISKKNNIDGFTESIRRMRQADTTAFSQMQTDLRNNNPILKWNDTNSARGTLDINLREAYGIERSAQGGGQPNRVVLTDNRGNITT